MSLGHDCIFCKVIASDSPKVYEDENIVAFNDITPLAPTHILFVPRKHYASFTDIPDHDMQIMSDLFVALKTVAKKIGVDKTGFNTVINTGKDAGQTVFHVHVHLLAGKTLKMHLS